MELLIGLKEMYFRCWVSPSGSVVENPSTNVGDTKDTGSIPGLGRFPGERNGNHSSILAWKIPRTEKPGEL